MAQTHTWREENGHPIHDDVCCCLTTHICTCGLLEHLVPLVEDTRFRIFPPFNGEIYAHERALDRALEDAG